MSRSRRKTPKVTGSTGRDSVNRKFWKRLASKTVRKYKGDVSDGNWYKKTFCSWNINDYKWSVWDKNSEWYKYIIRK